MKTLRELDRYRWSGHSVLMGYESRPWQASEEVLSYFGRSQRAARKKYRQFIFEGISMGRREDLIGGTKREGGEKEDQESRRRVDNRILGSSTFVEELLAEEEKVTQERLLFKRKRTNVEEFINLVGKKFGVTGEEIIGGVKGRKRVKPDPSFVIWGRGSWD